MRQPPKHVNHRPATVIRTTDESTISSVAPPQKRPFKLIPVVPPSKDKVPVRKSINRNLSILDKSHQPALTACSSHQPGQVLQEREIVSIPLQNTEAMVLEDESIMAVGIALSTLNNSGTEQHSMIITSQQPIVPSTHDQSSDWSFGEKEQGTNLSKYSIVRRWLKLIFSRR